MEGEWQENNRRMEGEWQGDNKTLMVQIRLNLKGFGIFLGLTIEEKTIFN